MLSPELVPYTAFFVNLRSELEPEAWDVIRRKVYKLAGYRCQLCGGKGDKWPVECHEVWRFRHRTAEQELVRLEALCPSCHEAKHFGLAQMHGNEERALKHIMKVNGWKRKRVIDRINRCAEVWRGKNDVMKWYIKLKWLRDFVSRHIMQAVPGTLNPRGANESTTCIDIPSDAYASGKGAASSSSARPDEDFFAEYDETPFYDSYCPWD